MKHLVYILLLVSIACFLSCDRKPTEAEKLHRNPDPALTLVRQPYLQTIYADSVSILWKTTNNATSCYVMYGKDSLGSKTIGKVERQHLNTMNEVTINGLEPATKYFYSIYTNDSLLAVGDDYYFITQPADSTTSKFSFYAMGDIGQPKERNGFPHITANQIDKLPTRPDFGLGLGDIVYLEGESEVADDYLFEPMAKINRNIPFYPALGNHDWRSAPDQNFEQEWKLPENEHYYGFAYANAYFIALDSRNGGMYENDKQTQWLEERLKTIQNNYDWVFVYLHHNGKSCSYKPDYEEVINLYPLFTEYNVDLVLNGHAHTYERPHPYDSNGNVLEQYRTNTTSYSELTNGFIQITTGAGGKLSSKIRGDDGEECTSDLVAVAFHKGHFSLIEVNGQELKFKAIGSKDGKVYDEFLMSKQ